jgi:hypothetical protein
MTPVGHKLYFRKAARRVEGSIEGACLVANDVLPNGASSGHWSLLVLTTDELRVFTLRAAGWRHPNTSLLDTELMHVPLGAIDRLDHQPSINPLAKAFRLTLTDGKRVTLRAGRGASHGGRVIERLTELVDATPRTEHAESPVVLDQRPPPIPAWRKLAAFGGLVLFLMLSEAIARMISGG